VSNLTNWESWGELWQGNPFLLLLILALPVAALARFLQIYPDRLLVALALVPTALTIGLVGKRDVLGLVLTLDAALALLAACDLYFLPRRRAFTAERKWIRVASLGKKHAVELTINNLDERAYPVHVRDDVPEEFEALPDGFTVSLPARSRAHLLYHLRARQRGAFAFDYVHLSVRSRWGMWRRILRIPVPSAIHVYPDLKQLAEYELLARTNRLSLMGVRRTRRVGQDNDFERLRDYTRDDNYKHIDWRSTARRNRLTVKDFQTSQSQRLIFLVDCGRMMTNRAQGISLLDHALNAMLMLSYIALKRGDSVGLLTFSDQIHSFVPPRGGSRQMNHLLSASFDRFPRLVESRYDEAFLHLSKYCRKRSLVILISNVIDEVNANQIHQYLSTLVGRHLPLGVLLRDHELFTAAEAPWTSDRNLFTAAAAAEILSWRHQVITDLQHRGVLALDVFPEEMTAPLINHYLEAKARNLL